MMDSFPGVALIVGASSRMDQQIIPSNSNAYCTSRLTFVATGRATSLQLSKQGCTRLALVDVDLNQTEALARACRDVGKQDLELLVLIGDLNDAETVRQLTAQVVEQYGAIYYAANCLDTPMAFGMTADLSLESFKEPAEVVQRTIWLWMREEISQALSQERNKGILSIVNVTTVHGVGSEPQLSSCAAASRAIVGMTRTTAMDYVTSGIRVNCVCHSAMAQQPSVDTQIQLEQKLSPSPLGRYLQAEEVAHAVSFLLATQSSGITGTTLPVDGGWSLYHY
ncbi:short chain dehydrogenase [Fusarium proliferatum]|nr:short chain dehydrogenase [Fusarium proliferatum]